MSGEDNKQLIRRYIQAVDDNETGDWSILDEYIAEDFVAHNPPFPGVSLDRDGMIVGRGVHAGELFGIPPTDNEVETAGIVIHRVRDGKIAEYWSVTDVARVLQQVGALSGPSN
jgi:predicted ester cyclase